MSFKKYLSNKNIAVFLSLILIIVFVLIYFKNKKDNLPVLAKVGQKIITPNDFLLNYEFGFPHLKIGATLNERKRNYLQFMINEYLFASDAESKNLNLSPEVKYQTEQVRRELLLETIINNDIKNKIKVKPDEIKDAINKSKVSFKFFFWPETDYENAIIIKEMFEQNGIENTFTKLSGKKSDFHFDYSKYVSDYKTWQDIPEETFNAIKNLKVNEFSNPVKIEDVYYVFQVQDVRRETLRNEEYLSQAPTFQKILFNAKLQDSVASYVEKLMTPKNIRTKTKVFNVFADAVIDWYTSPNKSTQKFFDWSKSALNYPSVQKYIFYRDSVLINFNGGSLTLAEFEKTFFMNNIAKEFNTKNELKRHLNFLVGQSMRDYFMVKEAEEKNYNETPWFEHEFMKWTSKFAFEEMMQKYNNEKLPNDKNLKDIINSDLSKLKNEYDIYVNYKMLDTLKIDETPKAKGVSIQLMKLGVNRMAEPIVDGYWKSLTN